MSNKKQNTIYDDLDILEIEENLDNIKENKDIKAKFKKNEDISIKEWILCISPVFISILYYMFCQIASNLLFKNNYHLISTLFNISWVIDIATLIYIFSMATCYKKQKIKNVFKILSIIVVTILVLFIILGLYLIAGCFSIIKDLDH